MKSWMNWLTCNQSSYVQLFARERSIADAGRVCFNNANDFPDCSRWDSEASQHAADWAVAARDIRIRSEVDVQHSSVSAFDEDCFSVTQCRVQVESCVFDIRAQFLGIVFVSWKFSLNVDLTAREKSLMSCNNRFEPKIIETLKLESRRPQSWNFTFRWKRWSHRAGHLLGCHCELPCCCTPVRFPSWWFQVICRLWHFQLPVSRQLTDGSRTPSERDPRRSNESASLANLSPRFWRAPQTVPGGERRHRFLK